MKKRLSFPVVRVRPVEMHAHCIWWYRLTIPALGKLREVYLGWFRLHSELPSQKHKQTEKRTYT